MKLSKLLSFVRSFVAWEVLVANRKFAASTAVFLLVWLAFVFIGYAQSPEIPFGKSHVQTKFRGTELELFCYKPDSYQGKRMILVMHGTNRNAEEYRDNAINMADRLAALIVAPKFDLERFPSIKYNRGGIVTEDQKAAPEDEWTYHFIPAIVRDIRKRESNDNLRFWMIGHSAGGQFLARMSAFLAVGAERVVAANPGSQLFPRRDWPFGYGFGDLPDSLASEDRIKNYLAAPLTIYLGTEDNKPDEYFDDSKEAMLQGQGRLQRGQACFDYAKRLAEQNNWPFHWRIVEANGVGHDHQAMFNHPSCNRALLGE
ncbi:MAG: hypothetical protein U0930_03380 [Pirellulales bacterium]